jgi:3-methylcrotonyl-CoA carboxylase alpha subunit
MDEAGSVEKLQTGLSAPMPGTIIKILADKGDSVIEGQTVMILEAMKMEHTILAPYTGTVSNIYYHEGDQVNENTELFEMLPVEKC